MPKIQVEVTYYDDNNSYVGDEIGRTSVRTSSLTEYDKALIASRIFADTHSRLTGFALHAIKKTAITDEITKIVGELTAATTEPEPEPDKTADELEAEGRDPGLRDRDRVMPDPEVVGALES